MVDQLSAKWLEAADFGVCHLPNLSCLKGMGVTFTNAFSNNPVCCPARATIATGLTSHGHGLLANGYRLNPSVPTFMKTLQMGGWRTGSFGKAHFYPFDSEMYPYPDYSEYGWEVNHNTEDNRTGEWLDWIEKEHPAHYSAVLATTHNWGKDLPYFAAYGEKKVNLAEKCRLAKEQMSWPKGFHAGPCTPGSRAYYPLPFPEEISQTNWITDKAIDFIDETPAERPLYSHISYVQPHPPFHTPERYLEQVNGKLIPEPVGYKTEHWKAPELVPDWHCLRKMYFADLVHIDRQIGRILDRLEQTNRFRNTIFFFTADHGEMLMDHGLMGKGANHYDACIRVPLIIAGPGMRQGTSCDLPVQHEDICPTVLDVDESLLGNHSKPLVRPWLKEEVPPFAGRSLMPLCRGEKVSDWRESAYVESYGSLCESPYNTQILEYPWKKTLRSKNFRYSFVPGRKEGEKLFDLKQDPQELNNVVNDPAYQEIRNNLREEMLHRVTLQDYPYPFRDLRVIAAH